MANRCKGWLTIVFMALAGGAHFSVADPGELTLSATDRVLVLAPHPDDEVIGCGGILQKVTAMNLPVRVVFLTNGDENQWSFMMYRKHPVIMPRAVRLMGEVRHSEAVAAARVLGVTTSNLTFLGYPDFGTMAIWNEHWDEQRPYRSLFTRASAVPYGDALRPGASHKGEDILNDLTTVIREFQPTKVFVSHPSDQNGDHRALYLFTRVALWDLEKEMRPVLYPYLVHFSRWPQPRRLMPEQPLLPPSSLAGLSPWQRFPLSAEVASRKLKALQAHRTQYATSFGYLQLFVRANELFGDFAPIPLPANTSETVSRRDPFIGTPDLLIASERDIFIGLEQEVARREGDDLIIGLRLTRPLARSVDVSIYAFGYRPDCPFAKMPKLRLKVGELGHSITDNGRRLDGESVSVVCTAQEIAFRVPLRVLGEPRYLLTSARSALAELPLDWLSWRVLTLP